ncbi:MAG: T9SS type A sorting domain-containing protein [Bacteroidales bacterium]|nr:T9SS type A sorting domain-containing protein [Bacteroidales bacterium]
MIKIYFTIIFLFLSLLSISQITIVKGDMPSANDSIRMSKALNLQSYNFTQTGTNFTWDYSQLTPLSQRLEKYVGMSSTPLIYKLVFLVSANLASKRDDVKILTINIEKGYNFFKKKTSSFRQVGFGAEINGIPTPISFTSDDYIYRFPMAYGNSDSSVSSWNISIPSIGSLKEIKKRVNHVDGWGSISTPYGTFQCIRIKTDIYQVDSIAYSTGGINIGVPQSHTEYTWYSKSIPFPILKATVSLNGLLTTIEYADSVRQFVGVETTKKENVNVKIYPNPSLNGFTITAQSQSYNNQLQIMDLSGRIVYSELISNNFIKMYPKDFLAKGVYILRISSNDSFTTKKIIIQ